MKRFFLFFLAGCVALVLLFKLPRVVSAAGSSALSCFYPVKVAGDSMEPIFHSGQNITFNSCFKEEKEDLQIGTPILFKNMDRMKISVIREKVEGDSGIFYRVSPESRQTEIIEVFPDNIVAIYKSGQEIVENTQQQVSSFQANPFFILGALITLAVFFIPIFVWRPKTNSFGRYFWAGILIWSLMITIKVALDLTITQKITSLGILIAGLYFGVRTGIFENGLKYFYAKKKAPEASFNQAVAFGIGFGGSETLLVGFQSLIVSMVLTFKPDFLRLVPPFIQEEMMKYYSSSTWLVFASAMERLSALFIHILATVLVFLSVKTGKMRYFWLAFLAKGAVDGLVPFLSQIQASSLIAWVYIIEIPLFILGLIFLFILTKIKKIYPDSKQLSTN